jgi:hypothetical protein
MKVIIAIAVAVIIAVVIGFVPIMQIYYTETVQYQDKETYYEDEPYQVTETYSEAVPLTFEASSYVRKDTIIEQGIIIINGVISQNVEIPIQIACVDVKNTDDMAGSFMVSYSRINNLMGSPLTMELYLFPNEVKTAECLGEYWVTIGDWSYSVTPDTKSLERERTITQYRQVQKERTVTKERFEPTYKKVSLFAWLLSKL